MIYQWQSQKGNQKWFLKMTPQFDSIVSLSLTILFSWWYSLSLLCRLLFQAGPDHFWRAWYIQRRQRCCTSRRSECGPWEHFHDFPRGGKSGIDWFSPGHSFGIFRQPEQTENCPLHGGVPFRLLHDSQRRQGITTEPQWRTEAMVYHGCFNFVVSIHETIYFGLCHVKYLFKIQTGVFILGKLRQYQ